MPESRRQRSIVKLNRARHGPYGTWHATHRMVRGTPQPLLFPGKDCCGLTTANRPASGPTLSGPHAQAEDYVLTVEGRSHNQTYADRGYPMFIWGKEL